MDLVLLWFPPVCINHYPLFSSSSRASSPVRATCGPSLSHSGRFSRSPGSNRSITWPMNRLSRTVATTTATTTRNFIFHNLPTAQRKYLTLWRNVGTGMNLADLHSVKFTCFCNARIWGTTQRTRKPWPMGPWMDMPLALAVKSLCPLYSITLGCEVSEWTVQLVSMCLFCLRLESVVEQQNVWLNWLLQAEAGWATPPHLPTHACWLDECVAPLWSLSDSGEGYGMFLKGHIVPTIQKYSNRPEHFQAGKDVLKWCQSLEMQTKWS